MNLVFAIILVVLVAFFIVPMFITMIKAYHYGAEISLSDIFGITLRKSNSTDFIKGLAGFQKNDIDIETAHLEAHHLAGGDLQNCLDGILYAKEKDLDVDIRTILSIDLAGKNVVEFLNETEKKYHLEVNDVKNKDLTLDFTVVYKYSVQSTFVEKDEKKIKDKVTEKLQRFMNSWDHTDPGSTAKMIRENILGSDFWEDNLKVKVLRQDVDVRQR